MPIVSGPFNVKYGANTLAEIETISIDPTVETTTVNSVQGKTHNIPGPMGITAELTFLETDIPSLSVILPQYHVAQGEAMSTGEIVNDVDGAIDVLAASCDNTIVLEDLVIESCANPAQIFRIPQASTTVTGVTFDDNIRRVVVTVTGNAPSGVATMQFYKAGGLTPAS